MCSGVSSETRVFLFFLCAFRRPQHYKFWSKTRRIQGRVMFNYYCAMCMRQITESSLPYFPAAFIPVHPIAHHYQPMIRVVDYVTVLLLLLTLCRTSAASSSPSLGKITSVVPVTIFVIDQLRTTVNLTVNHFIESFRAESLSRCAVFEQGTVSMEPDVWLWFNNEGVSNNYIWLVTWASLQ